MLVPSKSTQPPFHCPYTSGGCGGDRPDSRCRRGLEPGAWHRSCTSCRAGVVKSRVAVQLGGGAPRRAILNSAASAGSPASTQVIASAIGTPGRGATAVGVDWDDVLDWDDVPGRSDVDGRNPVDCDRCTSPSVECEHAATSSKGPTAERGGSQTRIGQQKG